jgi:serine/threonine protein kinase
LNPERWQQISRIFKSAISLDGEARAAYVREQCGGDESLRSEVEKLIESHRHASEENFIGGRAADDGAVLIIEELDTEAEKRRLKKDQQIGSYVILDRLGAGGMGEVYLARDSRLGRTVALKVISPDISADKRRMQRFRQEAKVASSLNQPNILTIFEFGEVEGLTFLATEFIDGETLRDYLRGKQLKLTEILDIVIQIVAALDAAHEARIVHRDIKPENVMIRRRDRVVKVLDFGLAKVAEKQSTAFTGQESEAATAFKTAPGLLMGTINYMSPEQAQAHAVDERTDIWSTGVMLYEMLTGVMPFNGPTSSHTLVQIIEQEPAPLTKTASEETPAELQRIIRKAMAKDPDERYQSARDMLIDLRALRVSFEHDPHAPYATRHTSPRRTSITTLVALAALLVVAGVAVWYFTSTRTATPANTAANAPVSVAERTLTYWITVQKYRNGKPYQDPFVQPGEIIFEADYRIRLNVRSPQPGYLYVLNEGPARPTAQPEFVALFPSPAANNGSAVLTADDVVQIPSQTWIWFDTEKGTEKLWLIFSKDPVPELEQLKTFLNTRDRGLITNAALNQAIQVILNNQGSPKPIVEKDNVKTTVKVASNLLVHPIRLEHY